MAAALVATCSAYAHVPHDIIYSLGVSPNYQEDGLVFSSSTQFGESHLMSSNGGETFEESHVGMNRALVTGHAFSPDFSEDGVVYMVSKQGYYRSSDRGKSWVKQPHFGDEEVLSVCASSEYAVRGDLYILTTTGLYVTGGNGRDLRKLQDYEKVSTGRLVILDGKLFAHRVFYRPAKKIKAMEHIDYLSGVVEAHDLESGKLSILESPVAASIISDFDVSMVGDALAMVVALKDGTVHLSTDSARTWQRSLQRNDDYVSKIRFSPDYANDRTILAGTAKGFIFFSDSAGAEWETRCNGLNRWVHHTDILTTKLVFSPDYANDKTIFLGRTTGFYKTTDRGAFWRHINVWNTKWGYFVCPAPGKGEQDVFTATYNSGLSRSRDNGATWEPANIGITSAFANGLVLSPNYTEDKTIFALDISTGLHRSTDAGTSWSKIEALQASRLSDKPLLQREVGISHHFRDDGLLFLFVVPRRILGVSEKFVWKYNDKTKEVKRVMMGSARNYIHSFAFPSPSSKRSIMFCASAQGLFRSTDKGDTWVNVTKGTAAGAAYVSPNVDRDGLVYMMDWMGRIHMSTNGGESFAQTDLGLEGEYVNNISFSPDYAADKAIYATTFGKGVLKSTDHGRNWNFFGLRGKFLYTGLSFSANYAMDRTIFAPTINGIYRTTDDGKSWANTLKHTQFMAKVPFLTFKDPTGKALCLNAGVLGMVKRYKCFDPEISPELHQFPGGLVKKLHSPKAYLATYYRFTAGPGYAVEVYFYGTSVDFKCVQGPDMGIVDIFLDDGGQGSFDMYSETSRFDVTAFRKDDLAESFHTLRIVSTGRKRAGSAGIAFTFNVATIEN
jgi:photosystem II stability/assembly factor-like uncharacterized protein